MKVRDIGRELIGTDDPEGDAERLGLQCMPPAAVARWRAPFPSPHKPAQLMKVNGPQRLDDLCTTCPVAWCMAQREAGLCVRSTAYWAKRLGAILAAVRCGCDPLSCAACSANEHRWGRAVHSGCRSCRHISGWERDHASFIRRAAAMMGIAPCAWETERDEAEDSMPTNSPAGMAEYGR